MHLPAATDLRVSAAVQADVVAASLCLASHVRDGEITISHEGSRAGGEAAQAGSTMARRPTEKRPLRTAGGQCEAAGRWGEPSAAHAGGGAADDAIRRTVAAPRL